MTSPRIAVEPAGSRLDALTEAVLAGGGDIVPVEDAEALVWADPGSPELLPGVVARGRSNLRWVQLPYAGVEPYLDVIDDERLWTCGKGVYATPVAEHVLALTLAGFRGLNRYACASHWDRPRGQNLFGARVTILGGGEITSEVVRVFAPFGCHFTVVRRNPEPISGVTNVLGSEHLHNALSEADLVVLALALTPETTGIIGREELALLGTDTWIVNVARGRHIVTDDLVAALQAGQLGGAALDVTDPEPLPEGHPLWDIENCLITPHVANTPEMGLPLLAARVTENVRRYAAGQELIGPVDPEAGY